MGATQPGSRSKKGVEYSKATGEITDCLFCRIVRGQSPPNQLWYLDDQCAIFIPRTPAARLHLLIVPLQHIQNVTTLTEEHRPLLEHMQKVAMEQLHVHSQYLGSEASPLVPLASPPSHYSFNRGQLPSLSSSSSSNTRQDEKLPPSTDPSFVFCFHRPPYNSIDHLHLHALQKPYRTWWNRFMFAANSPWHGSLTSVMHDLPPPKAKL